MPAAGSLPSSRPERFAADALGFVAEQAGLAAAEFRELAGGDGGEHGSPRPLYVTTATQIGLLPTAGIPDLPAALLSPGTPAACSQLLRRWLLLPPRPAVADAMHVACRELLTASDALPAARPLPVGKLVALVEARQGNVPFFRELRQVRRPLRGSPATAASSLGLARAVCGRLGPLVCSARGRTWPLGLSPLAHFVTEQFLDDSTVQINRVR